MNKNKTKLNLIVIIISIFFFGIYVLSFTGCGKKGDPIPKSAILEKKNV